VSEYRDSRDVFAEELLGDMPPVPSAAALLRVRERAAEAGGRRGRWLGSRGWQAGIALAGAACAMALGWGALAPHGGAQAFARDKAIAALVPKGCVLHTKSVATGRDVFEDGTIVATPTVTETWTDVERRVERSESHDAQTGEPTDFGIRKGNWQKLLGRDAGLDEKTYKVIPLQHRLVEYEVPQEVRSFTWMTDQFMDALRTGIAKVVKRYEEDGVDYWVVEARDFPGDDAKTVARATMRVSDYGLKEFSIYWEDESGSGHSTASHRIEYSVWETVPRDKLPADFFDYDLPNKRAPKGTIIDPPRKS
jgi:hypothetical protein